MSYPVVVALLLLLVSNPGFADLGRKHATRERTSSVAIYGARSTAEFTTDAPRITSVRSPGLYIFADDFDGANDTAALSARGYKTFYRGTGAQAAPTWFQGNPTVFSAYNGPADGYVGANFEVVAGANTIDSWLVLPALNIAAGDPLKFYERSPAGSVYPDSVMILYSAVGDSVPEAGSWLPLDYFETNTTGVWTQHSYLAPTSGSNARFAFRYYVVDGGPNGTSSDYLGIDALTVGPPPVDDIQVASVLLSPASPNVGQAITISAIINNVGSGSNPASLLLTYKIGSVPGSSGDGTAQTFTPSWTGITDTVSFTTTYTPSSSGGLTIGVRSFNAWDLNGANDSAKTRVNVYPAGTVLVGDFTTLTGWVRTGLDTVWFVGTAVQIDGTVGGAAVADFYDAVIGSIDTLVSPTVDLSAPGVKVLRFDHAYRNFSGNELDSVVVLVSSNAGTSWSELTRDGYPNMATLASSSFPFTPGSATDWRNNSFVIPSGLLSSTVKFAFMGVSDYGNNFWLDNVRVEPQATMVYNVPLASGWNLISSPVMNPVPGDSVRQLYPTSVYAYAFGFSGGYVQSYILANGEGYWEKFPAAITQPITGTARTLDSISVVAGWNIVGSISCTVDTGTIVSVPPGLRGSNWFKYAAGYTPATQLIAGGGYWVKANGAGKFVLMCPPLGAPKAQASGTGVGDVLNSVTITDSKGGSQTLYFGADETIPVSLYTMPPMPPVGAFDARFETSEGGSMVQTHGGESAEFTVAIQSDAYPVTVTWNVKDGSYELTAGAGSVQVMRGEGTMKISNSEVNRLFLKLTGAGELPKEYALSQNYPNPFNPTTGIKYALPVDSKVTMEIYNIVGQRVRTLVNDNMPAGYHVAEWDGTGTAGQQLASGVYFLQMSTKGVDGRSFSEVRKLMMLK